MGSPAADRITRTIAGDPILWTDPAGVVHLCEAADVHPEIRLIWTLCDRDVPAGAAYTREGEVPTCPACLRAAPTFRASGEIVASAGAARGRPGGRQPR